MMDIDKVKKHIHDALDKLNSLVDEKQEYWPLIIGEVVGALLMALLELRSSHDE
ncbi:MAG: hypothetical protein ABFD64_00030 [Armatimonadota bacterium]